MRLVAVSETPRRDLAQAIRLPDGEIDLILNAPFHSSGAGGRAAIRRELAMELGIPMAAPWILSVGRLVVQKRMDLLVEAVIRLGHMSTTPQLLIAGEGPERVGLQQMIGEAPADSFVHLLGHITDIPRLIAAADMFVLPSSHEGRSFAIMEAMAAAVPVVAAVTPATTELIKDHQSGFTSEPNDVASLQQRVSEILDNPEMARAVGLRGRETVRAHGESMATQMLALLAEDSIRR